jgi:hypothetical protein
MAPESLEPELRKSEWLVLAFAVRDAKDRPVIDVACQIAITLRNTRVAVRRFELADEFTTWAPELAGNETWLSVSETNNESTTELSIAAIDSSGGLRATFYQSTAF